MPISKKGTDFMNHNLMVSAPIFLIRYSDIDSLAYFAGMHRIVLGYHRLLSKRFPFAVYYRVVDDVVLVSAILDCRRNPSWIREKLSK